jgi:uncharacterized protein YkwD
MAARTLAALVAFAAALGMAGPSRARAEVPDGPGTGSDVPPCRPDDRLAAVAAALLRANGPVTSDELTAFARAAGVQTPALRAILDRAEGDGARVRDLLVRAARAADGAPLRCGEARDERRRAVVVGSAAGALVPVTGSSPVDRRVAVHLAPGFTGARVLWRDVGAPPEELPMDDDGTFVLPDGLRIPTSGDHGVSSGRLLQLVATGPSGPRPVAEVGLVSAEPPDPVQREVDVEAGTAEVGIVPVPNHLPVLAQLPDPVEVASGRTPLDALPDPAADAGRVRTLVDALRDEHGVSPLRVNRLLARVAAGHAAAVCAAGHAAHVLPVDGGPHDRIARAGLVARVVGEAVARGADLGAALRALVRSPSHVATLIDRRLTDIGVGVARTPGNAVCVVVALAAWPRPVAPLRPGEAAHRRGATSPPTP